MIRVRLILFSLTLLLPAIGMAQVDSAYIGSYPQKVSIMVYSSKEMVSLIDEQPEKELVYMPNNPVRLGLGFSWKNTVLSFAYGYPFNFMRNKEYGKTQFLDLQYHHYDRKFVFDLFLQKYKGFYMEENNNKNQYVICPDMSIWQVGMNAQYIFNHKRFSYKAAFVQNEKQLRSAGSLLLGGGIYFTNVQSDSSFVYHDGNSLDNFQFNANIGYAYTWVLGQHWFINGATSVGVSLGSDKINRFGKGRIAVYPTVLPRISVGYSHDKWALGLSTVFNINFLELSDARTLGIYAGRGQIYYVHRIDDIPFLSKLFDKLKLPF